METKGNKLLCNIKTNVNQYAESHEGCTRKLSFVVAKNGNRFNISCAPSNK